MKLRFLKCKLALSFAFAMAALTLLSASPSHARGTCAHGYKCASGGSPECGAIVLVLYDGYGNMYVVNSGVCCSCV